MAVSRRHFLTTLSFAPLLGRHVDAFQRPFAWVNEQSPGTYPAGVRHATFHSASNKTEVGYCVFLPPGYDAPENASRRYPVVYHLHGGFVGSELIALAAAPPIDAAMRQGHIAAAIYVFSNGGRVSHYDYAGLQSYGETALVKELIPHADATYRTIARRDARGIEGFSAGGRGTARIMFKYPDLFCSAVAISGGHQHEKYINEHGGRSRNPPDLIFETSNNTYALARHYTGQGKHQLDILIVVGTTDMNYEANLEWMTHLDALKIGYKKIVIEGVGHNLGAIMGHAGLDIMRFHAESRARSA
jgi:enterochelin esterase-like enzyme